MSEGQLSGPHRLSRKFPLLNSREFDQSMTSFPLALTPSLTKLYWARKVDITDASKVEYPARERAASAWAAAVPWVRGLERAWRSVGVPQWAPR